jgi:hypothetical protein
MALQVIEVQAQRRRLVLGGADIVNGSPVLDIKPYVPFVDSLPAAQAPAWVTVWYNGSISHVFAATAVDLATQQPQLQLGSASIASATGRSLVQLVGTSQGSCSASARALVASILALCTVQ